MKLTPVSILFTISTTALLLAVVQAASLPVTDLAVTRSHERFITTDVVPWNEDSSISTLDVHQVVTRAGDAVALELIKGGVKIVEAACTAGVWTCALAVVVAGLVTFFSIYAATNNNAGPGVIHPTIRRDIQNVLDSFKFDEVYTPTSECDATCQLKRLTPEGEWTKFAQIVSNGILHDIHHYYNGSTRGIQAWGLGTASTLPTKRTDQK